MSSQFQRRILAQDNYNAGIATPRVMTTSDRWQNPTKTVRRRFAKDEEVIDPQWHPGAVTILNRTGSTS